MIFDNPSLAQVIGLVVALVVGITVHEFSHAWTADRLGDHRPRALGRVSLDPRRHIDPIGALLFVVAGFGWGRPVPVNAYALRPGRIGMAWVALAGPAANLLIAALVGIVYRVLVPIGIDAVPVLGVLYTVVFLNVMLAFFNLLPIPPLDGYNVALPFLPPRWSFLVQRYAVYGLLVLVALIVLPGPLDWLIGLVAGIARGLIGA